MEQQIEGTVTDILKEKSKQTNYSIKTTIENEYVLDWKIRGSDLFYFKDPEYKVNDKVNVFWDNKLYTAYLKQDYTQKIHLVRDFSKTPEDKDQAIRQLEVLRCPSCGSNVPLEYEDHAVCLQCMTKIDLNDEQNKAVETSKEILKTHQNLFNELIRIFKDRLSFPLFKLFTFIPLLLLAFQIFSLFFGTFFSKLGNDISDDVFEDFLMEDYNFGLLIVLPSIFISCMMIYLTRKNAYSIDIHYLAALFSPKLNENNEYACRSCGSPVNVFEIPQMTVCPYCKTENIAVSNSKAMNDISKQMNIRYLIDIQILHNEFKNTYRKYYIGVIIGLLFFYGLFFAYTMHWEDIDDVPFFVHYIAMPFIVMILLHFLCQIAALPHLQFDDWLPKYFKEHINKKDIPKAESRPLLLRVMPFIQFGLFLLFFFTLFFMRE